MDFNQSLSSRDNQRADKTLALSFSNKVQSYLKGKSAMAPSKILGGSGLVANQKMIHRLKRNGDSEQRVRLSLEVEYKRQPGTGGGIWSSNQPSNGAYAEDFNSHNNQVSLFFFAT